MKFDPRPFAGAVYWQETGSRFICNPPVTDTDHDIVVWVSRFDAAIETLLADGWAVNENDPSYCYRDNNELPFFTARRGEVNLIVYQSYEGYAAFVQATMVAKHLNLTNKEDRIALFAAVCGGRGRPDVEEFA